MVNQRKYIIRAFLIFATLFIGIYFLPKIFSKGNKKSDVVQFNQHVNTQDTSLQYRIGKNLFQKNCAACHGIFRDFAGPALADLSKRGPWADKEKLYEYIRKPVEFVLKNEYAKELHKKYGIEHVASPDLTDNEIDAIVYYIETEEKRESLPIP